MKITTQQILICVLILLLVLAIFWKRIKGSICEEGYNPSIGTVYGSAMRENPIPSTDQIDYSNY